jgi:hypothetical protein
MNEEVVVIKRTAWVSLQREERGGGERGKVSSN